MERRILVLIVPDPTDRAFYKALLIRTYRTQLEVVDLDSEECKSEREELVRTVLKPWGGRLGRLATLKLVNTRVSSHCCTYVIIIPSERGVADTAQTFIEYLLGADEYLVDYVIVAEDAEEESPEDRIREMLSSLERAARQACAELREVDRGVGYCEVELCSPRGIVIRVLLLVQGVFRAELEELTMGKHAIEDFVLYLHKDLVRELRERCPDVIEQIVGSRDAHKKLALLIAIMKCFYSLESFMFRELDFDRLVNEVESLRKLKVVIDRLCRISAT